MLRRDVQVQRLRYHHVRRRLLDDDRFGIDQRRRRPAAQINSTIDARRYIALDRHGDVHVRVGSRGSSKGQRCQRSQKIGSLHNNSFRDSARSTRARGS
jgi:hypothetical protein